MRRKTSCISGTAAGAAGFERQVQPAAEEFHGLRFAEQFALWSLRLWHDLAAEGRDAAAPLEQAWRRVGAADAVAPLEFLCHALAASARRRIDIRPVRSAELSDDEQAWLWALAGLQAGQGRRARIVLDAWLPTAGVRLALPALATIAGLAAGAGLRLPQRRLPEAARPKPIDAPAERAGHLVH